jgi:hypothetical protein
MSEAAAEPGAEDIKPVEKTNEEEMSPAEVKARAGGWKPPTEFDDDDPRKPTEFYSPEEFNIRGEFIGRLKEQQKAIDNFDSRLENQRKLLEMQNEAKIKELTRNRDAAIDLADKDAAVGYQEEIDNLKKPVEPAAQADADVFDRWNAANPWIYQGGPKAAYAQHQLNTYAQQGLSNEQALARVDSDLAREFPAVNQQREREPTPEPGSKPGKKRGGGKLSMNDVTPEELKWRSAFPGAWKNDAEFLQAVQDSRGKS